MLLIAFFCALGLQASGQTVSSSPPPAPLPIGKDRTTEEVLERHFVINFIEDQKAIWTSPLHVKKKDLFWLVPSAAVIGESLHRDAYMYRKLTPTVNPGNTSKSFSDAGVLAMAGGVAGMYMIGRLHGNDHQRETAVLSTEALADSMTVGYLLKYALQRDRPFNTGRGDFFTRGGGTSFPSGHALAAWSMATVVAHEYPGVLTQIGAYGLATAISVARVTGRQHFPTDVIVGSALGWGIGTLTYRRHHDPDLPGEEIGNFKSSAEEESGISNTASPAVPLDNWIYSAFDRLYALGFVPSAFRDSRPWTRLECVRLINEAEDLVADSDESVQAREAKTILSGLESEFNSWRAAKPDVRLESLYTRARGISGQPLSDGYHFAQTTYNDFGRPYSEGMNAVTGISGSASSGRWSAYARAEYQHAPAGPALPDAARLAISSPATGDATPLQPAAPIAEVNRLRILDAYVAMNLANWQLSFGKQSLWWGPGDNGAMNFSDNAEPITMIRLARVVPFVVPHILNWMGPIKAEFFVGRLAGQRFVRTDHVFTPPLHPQPLIDGEKLSFKPTRNLEFGFSVTTIFGGPGFPVTTASFLRTFSFNNEAPQSGSDPGDRRSGFDFSYRVPKFRDWLVLYNDSFTEDEISPIAYPRRSAMRSGIYMPHFPKFPRADFRVEGVYTDLPNLRGTGVYYFNTRYLSGFTNNGNIIADWIGREGQGLSVESTYWFSAVNRIKLGYRTQTVNPDFLQGGHLQDFAGESSWSIRPSVLLSGGVQFEHWNFPILGSPRSNITTTIEVKFLPHQLKKRP